MVGRFLTGECLLALVMGIWSPEAMAQKGNTSQVRDSQVEPNAARKSARVSQEDRNRVMSFTGENHPELGRLLEQLEKSRPAEFSRAVRELTLQIQQLERVRDKNPTRYRSHLESWQLDSQIRVLMARWAGTHDPEIEKQVRGLLERRRQRRLEQTRADRERLAEQLRRLDEQIVDLASSEDVNSEKEWDQLSKKAGSMKVKSSKSKAD